jgi:hypothetical protein
LGAAPLRFYKGAGFLIRQLVIPPDQFRPTFIIASSGFRPEEKPAPFTEIMKSAAPNGIPAARTKRSKLNVREKMSGPQDVLRAAHSR